MGQLENITGDDVTAVVAESRQLHENTDSFLSAVLISLSSGERGTKLQPDDLPTLVQTTKPL